MKDFLRQSQVLTTFGPGAMVDLPDRAVLIEGLQSWRFGDRKEEIHEPRLRAKLMRKLQLPEVRLVKPPAFDERPGAKRASIGARIFPEWFLVQDAKATGPGGQWRRRRLVRFDVLVNGKFRDDDVRPTRNVQVVPVRFVCGCPRGHLDELDWRVFAHRSTGPSCGRAMWIEERGTSGDISETVVGCECGVQPRPLYDALGLDTRALGTCKGRRPWLGPHTEEDCTHPLRLLVRSASNAYFPQLFSVISLPQDSAADTERLDPVWNILGAVDDVAKLAVFRTVPDVAKALEGLSDAEAWVLIQTRKGQGTSAPDVPVKLAEFELLDVSSGTRGRDGPESPFYAEALARNVWDTGAAALQRIERVVLAHRLREVVAQVGFTRFDAAGADANGELDLGVESAALDVNREWFPAIDNRGEGIFIVFRADAIQGWLAHSSVKQRGALLMRGCQ